MHKGRFAGAAPGRRLRLRASSRIVTIPPPPGHTVVDGFLDTAECAALLKAMGDPKRLSILRCLVRGERPVTEMARALKLPQPAVSHHLAILRQAGLLTQTREGRKVIYRLHPSAARHLREGEETFELGCCSVSLRKP